MMSGRCADEKRLVESSPVPVAMVNGSNDPFFGHGYVAGIRYANLWGGMCHVIPDAGPDFANWVKTNIAKHKAPGYAIATITLKTPGQVPGDATSEQMDIIADLMDEFSVGEVRVTHEQNLVLPHVRKKDLPAIYAKLKELDFAAPNAGLITDIIACPGLDYCDLANARSIPIAQKIAQRFENLDRQHEIGELKIKISGCINACGHHHAGHIGILGVDKKGVEFYQLLLGGSGAEMLPSAPSWAPASASMRSPMRWSG